MTARELLEQSWRDNQDLLVSRFKEKEVHAIEIASTNAAWERRLTEALNRPLLVILASRIGRFLGSL